MEVQLLLGALNVPRRTMKNEPGIHYPGVAAGAIILNEKDQVFLMLRSDENRNDHGKWAIPGGKVEMGELVEDGVKREALEESGVVIERLTYISYVDHILNEYDQHWVSHIFYANKWSGEAKNMEPHKFDTVGWFNLESLPENTSQVVVDGIEKFLKQR